MTFEMKSNYHSFDPNFILLLTQILSFQDDVIPRNMFYFILFKTSAGHGFVLTLESIFPEK